MDKSSYAEISDIIKKCCRMDPKAQEKLYRHFYGYGMSIALRYAGNRDDAVEILNDSFLKVFMNIKKFIKEKNFKSWLRRIIINTSIDKLRAKKKIYDKEIHEIEIKDYIQFNESLLENLMVEDIIKIIRQLPDMYRLVFNLYEVEGFSHEEISIKLNINKTTSRSNLSRAKDKLRVLLKESYNYEKTGQ